MKRWRDAASPWGVRLRFEESDFEAMMSELLGRAGKDWFEPGKGVDVDLVLLRALDIEADYVDLPEGMLGRTLFKEDGGAAIEVSRALAEEAELDAVARRRLRSTVAHECGHVACHRQLFVRDCETLPLFGQESRQEQPSIMCRNEVVDEPRYRGEWWEFQANRCMAALLMPTRLLEAEVATQLRGMRLPSITEALRKGSCESIVRALMRVFDVSFQGTYYRLAQLGYLPAAGQVALSL
jgi:hypothetical protein